MKLISTITPDVRRIANKWINQSNSIRRHCELCIVNCALTLALLLAVSACTDEVDIYRDNASQDPDCISFSIEEADVWVANGTRSSDTSTFFGSPAESASTAASSGTSDSSLPTPLNPEIIPLNNPSGAPLYLHISAIPTSVYNASLAASEASELTSTRGALVASSSQITGKIGLIAIKYRENDADHIEGDTILTYLYQKGSYWVPDEMELQWKNCQKYDFYAYYPYVEPDKDSKTAINVTTRIVKKDKPTTPIDPTIKYTNQAKVADDPDLLVAHITASEDECSNGSVPLKFRHPLASVIFKAASDFKTCKIRGLAFGNNKDGLFQSSANLSLPSIKNSETNTPKWNPILVDAKKPGAFINSNFSLDFGYDGEELAENGIVSNCQQAIMIIPTDTNTNSTITPTAKVNIALEMEEEGEKFIMGAPDEGIEVPLYIHAGYTTTYIISNSGNLSVTKGSFKAEEKVYVSYAGCDELPIDVHSTIFYDGKELPVGWKAEIYEGDESAISIKTTSGGGLYNNGQVLVKVNESEGKVMENYHLTNLQGKPQPTPTDADGYYDLSSKGEGSGQMTTANCYVINAQGKYKFPLVYGNGVKDGAYNETCGINKSADEALTSSSTTNGANTSNTNFVDYKGDPIASEKIEGAANAFVLWHDATRLGGNSNPLAGFNDAKIIKGIILKKADASKGETYDYVEFEVSGDPKELQQANAVIAVTDAEGKIMWNWHLWITDYDPYTDKVICHNTLNGGPTYQAFRYPLGYCDGPEIEKYEKRSFKIKLTQDLGSIVGESVSVDESAESPFVRYIEVIQQPFEKSGHNNVVMYQARRKDPFIAATHEDVANLPASDLSKIIYAKVNGEYLKKGYWADGYGFMKKNEQVDIGTAIGNPNVLYWKYDSSKDMSWFAQQDKNDRKSDLWNSATLASSNGASDVSKNIKTIYDPCPPGFMVPPTSFWNIWAEDNVRPDAIYDHSHIKKSRGVWLWSYGVKKIDDEVTGEKKIVHAYSSQENEDNERLFLSANGRRQAGNLDRIGSYCMYWDTGGHDNGGWRFWVDSTRASSGDNGASAGASILPVAEQ